MGRNPPLMGTILEHAFGISYRRVPLYGILKLSLYLCGFFAQRKSFPRLFFPPSLLFQRYICTLAPPFHFLSHPPSHRFASFEKKQSSNNAAIAEQNNALVVTLAVTLAMVLIRQEEVLVAAVSGKRNSGYS